MLLDLNPKTGNVGRLVGKRLGDFGLDERKFQDILFRQLDRLIPEHELLLIAQSQRWREEPDLIALDAAGRLYLFELKVWESSSENLLQVLRYGQLFGAHGYDDLDRLYRKRNKTTRSLADAHRAVFGRELRQEEFNSKQMFVVLTNGIDVRTREACRYWRSTGLDVRPWVYRVYPGEAGRALLEFSAFRVEDDPYEDVSQGYFVLNTNRKEGPEDEAAMLAEKRAAAFFSPWKQKIERLSRGDWVFLYRSGQGIVALGQANGKLEKRPYRGKPEHADEEYSMVLNNFRALTKPLAAAEIKEITGTDHVFRQTMFGLSSDDGERLRTHLLSMK